MEKGKWILKRVLGGIVLFVLAVTVTMLLWNWLIPTLFSGPQVNFWQAVGLLMLGRILFGGWGRGGCRHAGGHAWKHRYYEKLASMSPEERERFKARMKEKWCSPAAARVNRDTGSSID